jgi:hypothetical protein
MKRLLAAMTAALMMVALVSSTALAKPSSSGNVIPGQWRVWNVNAAGTAYVPTNLTASGFKFLSTPDTALLTTSTDKSLLGNLTGKTITATFTINASAGATFAYYIDPLCTGTTPASAHLYFAGNGQGSGTDWYSNYWFSNPNATTLVSAVGNTVTLTAPINTANWSDWGGEAASAVSSNFAAAVASVNEVGLSFGGGCGFLNGVGMSAGSATFILTGYTVN